MSDTDSGKSSLRWSTTEPGLKVWNDDGVYLGATSGRGYVVSELGCIDAKPDSACEGEVLREWSASGATQSDRCRKHRDEYLDRMDKVKRDVSSRYPGYDVPGSMPPDWFDPTYAGERWDEDD